MKAKKLVRGVGINDADYDVRKHVRVNGQQKLVWACRYYTTWGSMLNRCYSAKLQEHRPTYIGCTVSEEWLTFSNFKSWMEAQDWQDKQLDKDLLFEGNKVYSPETCVFVSPLVNTFTTEGRSRTSQGGWMIGVCWNKTAEKFHAQCNNPFTKKREYLGLFACEQEAHEVWLKRKLELAHQLAAIQTDTRVAKALIDRYSKPN